MTDNLLTLGASLHSNDLPQYRDWLLDKQRDLEIIDLAFHEELDGNWLPNADHIRQQLDGYTGRMGIHGPFQGLPLGAYDSEVRAIVANRLLKGLDYCEAIGGTHMVMHSPFEYLGTPMVPNTPDMGQQVMIDRVAATLEKVLPRAEALKCTLVIETTFDRVPGVLLALVRSFESDYLRLSIDTGHVYINYCQNGGAALDYWVKEAGSSLAHVHIQDTDGYVDRHWAVGDGNINWQPVMQALNALEQSPRMIIELKDKNDIPRSAQYLIDRGLAQ